MDGPALVSLEELDLHFGHSLLASGADPSASIATYWPLGRDLYRTLQ